MSPPPALTMPRPAPEAAMCEDAMEYDAAANSKGCYDLAIASLRERLEASKTIVDGGVIYNEDCRFIAPTLRNVDSIVTDPPYHLTANSRNGSPRTNNPATPHGRTGLQDRGFMGKQWDGGNIAFDPELWRLCLQALKPGGHLLAFGGTRTYHRMACAIEDAGFEIRDCIMWVYGSGFPKSHNVSKQLDAQEKNIWLNVIKAVDNCDETAILDVWKRRSEIATDAGLKFAKSPIETGTSTPKSAFARAHVSLPATPKKSSARAIIAELSSGVAPPTDAELRCFALSAAAEASMELSAFVTIAACLAESPAATPSTVGSTAHSDAPGTPSASTQAKHRAVEALKTWLGSAPSSRREDTAALCAALTDALKLITLSQSATFRRLDTKSQMAFVSATTVTITESTAASLIASTVDTLRSKGIDRAAGAEREKTATGKPVKRMIPGADQNKAGWEKNNGREYQPGVEAPRTEAAKQWEGWGTALKPAFEPIIVARKPLSEKSVAANVLEHGTGAINVDGCRVGFASSEDQAAAAAAAAQRLCQDQNAGRHVYGKFNNGTESLAPYLEKMSKGRWPANFIHDGSEEVTGLFPASDSQRNARPPSDCGGGIWSESGGAPVRGDIGDSGSAARFFYCAKADKDDRLKSKHPTVKPIDLMAYLVRLVTPPGGTVLDPFAGSGATGMACMREGFRYILIEREREYFEDILARVSHVRGGDTPLFANPSEGCDV